MREAFAGLPLLARSVFPRNSYRTIADEMWSFQAWPSRRVLAGHGSNQQQDGSVCGDHYNLLTVALF
jgi:hypothetical protein